jgi:hydroxymethylbilane synthase
MALLCGESTLFSPSGPFYTLAMAKLRIGTRASPLALIQANIVARCLADRHADLAAPDAIEIVPMRTTGDRIQDRTLAELGGKGLFTKEIEEALLARTVDLAVHSMKDMPTRLPQGLVLGCFLERGDPRDSLICNIATTLDQLPQNALIGTASLRRAALVLHRRPDLRVIPLRGNVDTRLRKLNEGLVDATLLACAGLDRLGKVGVGHPLSPAEMLPAVGQGAICVEHRQGDDRIAAALEPLNHFLTAQCVLAEHALLAVLDGSCRTPIGGFAEIAGDELHLRALIAKPDGSELHFTERRGGIGDGVTMGIDAAEELKRRGGADFFAA